MLLSGEGDRRWQAEDARSVERGVGEQEEENRHQQQNLLRHDRGEHALQHDEQERSRGDADTAFGRQETCGQHIRRKN